MNNLNHENEMPLANNQHMEFENLLDMLIVRADRILIRSILLTLIDYTIIYDNLNNNDRIHANNVRNNTMNFILDPNSQWLVDSIMNFVDNLILEQRIYIFNRVTSLFRGNPIAG